MSTLRKRSQLETRQKLLDAAAELTVRDGLAALSTRAVCLAAGFTQGAFYSNFTDMDALLLALMEQHLDREIDNLGLLVAKRDGIDLASVTSALTGHFAALTQNRSWSVLSVELQLHALRDPAFADNYDKVRARYIEALSGILARLAHAHAISFSLSTQEVASGLHALWTGMAVQGRTAGGPNAEHTLLAFLGALTDRPAQFSSSFTIERTLK